ncbi:calcium binding egf domain-containing protein, partial [Cystoisospora suis]
MPHMTDELHMHEPNSSSSSSSRNSNSTSNRNSTNTNSSTNQSVLTTTYTYPPATSLVSRDAVSSSSLPSLSLPSRPPSLGNGELIKLQDLGQLAVDLSTCDPKTEGICCLARHYCDPNATCFSDVLPESVFEIINAIPRCTCREGFEGDGRTKGTGCSNIDECAVGIAGCEQICKDFSPGYACSCYDGYRLKPNGKECEDINECQEMRMVVTSYDGGERLQARGGGCQHICLNTPGSYQCLCAP